MHNLHKTSRNTALTLTLGLVLSACGTGSSPAPNSPDGVAVVASPGSVQTQALPSGTLACFYEHVNYAGASLCYGADASWTGVSTNNWIGSAWNDRVSSVKLQGGAQLELFADVNLGGRSLKLGADTPSLVGLNFNDLTSSFRISRSSTGSTPVDQRPGLGVISYWQPAAYTSLPAGSLALVNPQNGIVGASQDQIRTYQQVVQEAGSRGVRLLGYVRTGYGQRDPNLKNSAGSPGQSLAGIQAEVRAYVQAFGTRNLAGIFFDEADNVDASGQTPCQMAASEYASLSLFVRDQGLKMVAWNPGWVGSDYCYIKAAQPGDIVVDFESSLTAYQTDPFIPNDLKQGQALADARGVQTWHLIHSASGPAGLKTALDLLKERKPTYGYATDIGGNWQAGENTWGSPPSYWDAEKNCLASGVCP